MKVGDARVFAPFAGETVRTGGVASAVKNDVSRVVGSGSQPLALGSDLFTNERIRTGEASAAQILFVDKTTLMIGARAELTLDRFVYEPSTGTGQVVLNAIRGAFRFATGSQNPRNYTIKTPIGTVGIRGSGNILYACDMQDKDCDSDLAPRTPSSRAGSTSTHPASSRWKPAS